MLKPVVSQLKSLEELNNMVPDDFALAPGSRAGYELRINSALGLEWSKRLPTLPPVVKYKASGEIQLTVPLPPAPRRSVNSSRSHTLPVDIERGNKK
jgi:hypothetical protein